MLRPTLILLALLTLPLRANLGETIQQCVARYGQPLHFTEANPAKSPFGTLTFAAGGYALTVFVLNNVEVGARVFKIDKTAFSPAEMQTIMGADTAGSSWTSVPSNDPTCLQWTRSDKATALYDQPKKMLIFTSAAMAEALRSMPDVPAAATATNGANPSAVTPSPVGTNAATPSTAPPPSPSGN